MRISTDLILWIPAGLGLLWFSGGALLPWGMALVRRFEHSEQRVLDRVIECLARIREMIQAGVPPGQDEWQGLQALPAPWGPLSFRLLDYLRAQGAAVVPTLHRLEASARQEKRARAEAQVQSAQARSQIFLGLLLVPAASAALGILLPSVRDHSSLWIAASLAAFALNLFGLMAVLQQIEAAVRGGLAPRQKGWPSQARCAGEAVLAFLRGGTPPDQAWMLAVDALAEVDEEQAALWGRSLWVEPTTGKKLGVESQFQAWGMGLRRILHVALMEGYSSAERLEAALTSFSDEWNYRVLDSVSRMATRALRPLFLSLLPSLAGLMALAVFLEITHG